MWNELWLRGLYSGNDVNNVSIYTNRVESVGVDKALDVVAVSLLAT
jgi:16S rRNA G527 N7-methylase RsmG